jgi:hypothetical protein
MVSPQQEMGPRLSSVARNGNIASGPAPLVATAILAATGSGQAIALYIFACAVVSVAATALLPSARDRDFTRDHLCSEDCHCERSEAISCHRRLGREIASSPAAPRNDALRVQPATALTG